MKVRAIFFCGVISACMGAAHAAPAELKLATWNLEWLMTPETLRALTPACTPNDAPRDGARRAVPCDVAHELARSGEDIAALARYAHELAADVVALQEIDGADAARRIFSGYEFCFSGRVAVQNNGFAIRRGIPYACAPDITDISLADDVRRGVELRLFPGTPHEMRLLSVHLKSGCARDALDCLSRHRLRQEAYEIAGMAGFHRNADFAVGLETSDSRTMPGAGIDDDERPAVEIYFDAFRRNDAHERIIYRFIELAAVNDQFGGILQDMRRRLRDVFPILIAASTQDVQEQDAPLASVHHELYGRSDKP